MAEPPCAVVAFLRARPGRGDEVAEQLLALGASARNEPGNIDFQVHRGVAEGGLVVLYEVWRDDASLDRHLALPAVRAFLERSAEYLENDVEAHPLVRVTAPAGITT